MCSNVYWLTLFSLTDMAVHLSFLLIFTGLTGIDSITTLRKAAVEPGGSITIPCHYGSQYRNHVKYLCEGNYFSFCSIVVQTNTQHHSSRFAISDNKPQRIFTVIINNLTEMDTGYYWCGVEINGWSDDGNYFHLSVNRGTPSLYVVQQAITVSNGFNITINCHYKNSGEMKWCRLGGACVAGSSGTIDGTRVTINGSSPDVFTVIMSELTTESSGWYLCIKGDLDMPVHLTVTERHASSTTKSPTNSSPTATTPQHRVFILSFAIPLSLLIVIVVVALFMWFIFKRHQRNKAESTTTDHTVDECLTYSDIVIKGNMRQMNEPTDESVIYSTPQTKKD
ncbi:polymeric immunoglobulin receptor-like isoform X2 [Mastacembelus armatus]|uniref:Polymeric immunoglobulin receptor-like n=1 Tax=Mastacembelus armatus TaxID=205130 RepID=A0A3Q3MUP4_9TELE|nr:polymeric immunoglobulin receptor-like isoform X2 [Mastacembelus armatus]